MRQRHRRKFLGRVLLVTSLVALFIAVALFSWAIIDVLLLAFLGVLLGVLLRTLAQPIARSTFFSNRGALGVVLVVLVLLFAAMGWLLVPEIIAQSEQLVAQIGIGISQLEAILTDQLGLNALGDMFGDPGQPFSPANMLIRLVDTFTLTLEILGNALFVMFIGLFAAFDPDLYRRGIISLIPPDGRSRAREVIDAIVDGLRNWLLGQLISMVVIGVVVSLGLGLLGTPLALVLGVIAGLLEFIPVLGPVLASVPGILIAFTQSPLQVVYVALFYLVVEQLEGNVLTPIVQHRMVSLPPALVLSSVLAMGLVFGLVGVLVATPLTVVVFIVVRMLYLEDVLNESSKLDSKR